MRILVECVSLKLEFLWVDKSGVLHFYHIPNFQRKLFYLLIYFILIAAL